LSAETIFAHTSPLTMVGGARARGESGPAEPSARWLSSRASVACTDDQSCERQERDLRAFAKQAGHKIVGVFKETASGARNDRVERNKVMALARNREIDAILVTELSRWGRSTQDLVQTLDDLHSWKISVLAQTGLTFDLSTSSGKLMRTILASLSSSAILFGSASSLGSRPPRREASGSDASMGRYRLIARNLRLSNNTVMDIVRREVADGRPS
jgi:hypothetical protein